MISVDLLTVAKKVNNYIADATVNGAGNDKWTSTTVQSYTVPANKRWILLGGNVKPDASATVAVTGVDAAGKVIHQLLLTSAGTARVGYPGQASSASSTQLGTPFILDAGEYIYIVCGAAQGAGATASCVVLEIDV